MQGPDVVHVGVDVGMRGAEGDSEAAAGFRCGEILMKGRSEYVGLLDKAEGLGKKKSRHNRYT